MAAVFEWSGILNRLSIDGDQVSFRIYPFTFDSDLSLTPVLFIELSGVDRDAKVLDRFVAQEVNVEIIKNSVCVEDYWASAEVRLTAEQIQHCEIAYDLEDFSSNVIWLEKQLASTNAERTRYRSTLDKIEQTVSEMIRRAEIKSAASKALKSNQSDLLKHLHRIKMHLKE